MLKTGERYSTARANLLRSKLDNRTTVENDSGIVSGYKRFGGIQSDTAIVSNLFEQSGIRNPATGSPFSESMIHGLCGGPGFMYALFEYKDTPPLLTITTRNKSMPDVFIASIFDLPGVESSVHESGSVTKAAQILDEMLESDRASICVVDMTELPYYHMPKSFAGMSPHQVAVAGRDRDEILIDDRSIVPRRIDAKQFSAARAGYRKAKNRLITVSPADEHIDLSKATLESVRQAVYGYETGDVGTPPQFRSNCGFAGMEKWRDLLTDRKNKKGWPSVFGADSRAYIGLRRAYDCIQFDDTAPNAGRGFYAEFLDEAKEYLTDTSRKTGLAEAAELFRGTEKEWQLLSETIANSDPSVAAGCEVTDRITELADSGEADVSGLLDQFWSERLAFREGCHIDSDAAFSVFESMADRINRIIDGERRAVELLKDASK